MKVEIHYYKHIVKETPSSVLSALARVESKLAELLKKENQLMTTVAELTERVKNEESVGDSLVTLVQGLKERLDAAGTDPDQLKALSDDLDAHAAAWGEAIVANTPADPAATTDPQPTDQPQS